VAARDEVQSVITKHQEGTAMSPTEAAELQQKLSNILAAPGKRWLRAKNVNENATLMAWCDIVNDVAALASTLYMPVPTSIVVVKPQTYSFYEVIPLDEWIASAGLTPLDPQSELHKAQQELAKTTELRYEAAGLRADVARLREELAAAHDKLRAGT
jgi:hypothetical protein